MKHNHMKITMLAALALVLLPMLGEGVGKVTEPNRY